MRKRVKDYFQGLELGKVLPTAYGETGWKDGEPASARTDRQEESAVQLVGWASTNSLWAWTG